MALLGSSIDPRLQLQDYSGIVNAAQMQAQGLASIGQSIEAAAEQYKQYKKEQADTQKRVKAAANLADSISALVPELKGPLGATVAQLKDPNLTLADKDALAQSISSTLQLGIGAVTTNKELALKERQVRIAERTFNEGTPEQRAAAKQKQDEFERQNLEAGNYAKGALKNLPPGLAKQVETDYLDPQNYDGIGAKAFVEGLNTAKSQGYEFKQDAETGAWYAINKNPPFDVQPIPAPMTAGKTPIDQSIQGAAGMPVGQLSSATGISGALYTPGAGVAAPIYQPERDMPGGTILPTISPYYETIQEDIMSAMGMPQAPMQQAPPDQVRAAAQAAPATPQAPAGIFKTTPSRKVPLVSVSSPPAPPAGYQNVYDDKGNLVRQEVIPGSPTEKAIQAEEAAKKGRAENYLATLGDYFTKLNKDVYQGTGVIGANARAISQRILGTEMNKLQSLKSTLDANAFVNTIARLRENSPTGATGLGSVTEREGQRLVDLSGNIDPINIDTAKTNTERLLMEVADQAYGTKEFRDKQLKNKEITRDQYDKIMDLRGIALRGEFGKMLNLKIQAEREASTPTRPSGFGGFNPEAKSIIDKYSSQ